MVNSEFTELAELEDKLMVDLKDGYLLTVIHPVTEEYMYASKQAEVLIKALNKINLKKVMIMPNNDAGSSEIQGNKSI